MKYFSKRYLILALLALILTCIIGSTRIWYGAIATRSYFSPQNSPLTQTYDLFDLGVTDFNLDGNLDLFTLNHSARQNLLSNDGGGEFTDVLSELNLDQDRQFPELEDTDRAPVFDSAGLYIYRQNFDLHLYAHQIGNNITIAGSLKLYLPVKILDRESAEAEITTDNQSNSSTIEFTLKNNGRLRIKDFPEVPHLLAIEPNISTDRIYLGLQKLHPDEYEFDLTWRDRHSMAWADLNNDNLQDAFVSRGGARGQLNEISETIHDELFISQPQNRYVDRYVELGLEKGTCPGRQAAWVDFDRDDRLDLYNTCGRVVDDPKDYPHQLYRQESGGFKNVASDVGLDLPEAGYFVWLDGDLDGDLDLLASQEEKIRLYLNTGDRFEAQSELSLAATVTQLAVADFDLDGDFDVYTVTKNKYPNSLLINNDGKYSPFDPQEFGLPVAGVDASWVDYDNDGLVDLHVVPYGLYRQNKEHQFNATQLLNWQVPPFETWEARSAWFDYNNDGSRDLAIAYRQTPSVLQPKPALRQRIVNQIHKRDTSKIWQSAFYKNIGAKNHWLQVKLAGIGGNNPAIGAKVKVTTPKGIQTQQVGMSENSHYSQGHYRLYFGLGRYSKADLVRITWSNGEVTELNNLTGDRLLTVEQEAT